MTLGRPLQWTENPVEPSATSGGPETLGTCHGRRDVPLGILVHAARQERSTPRGTESLLRGLPDGCLLSDGARFFRAGVFGSVVDVSTWDLAQLAISLPNEISLPHTIHLILPGGKKGDSAGRPLAIDLQESILPEEPAFAVASRSAGLRDRPIPLWIAARTTSSSIAAFEVAGLGPGLQLTAGNDLGDGRWTLGASELHRLEVLAGNEAPTTATFTVAPRCPDRSSQATSRVTIQIALTKLQNAGGDLPNS